MGYLKQEGFSISDEIEYADIAIINTCCFIREAEEESIDAILKLCQLKKEGKVNKIIVCGCLAQRYKRQLCKELKEIDAFMGVGSIDKVVEVVKQLKTVSKNFAVIGRPNFLYSHRSPRVFLTPKHFTYVKISEGCNHYCSYCIIPSLRGRYRSRPMNSILKEANSLFSQQRVSEINLIGQDTTMYGQDLYSQSKIAALLNEICKLKNAKGRWIRLLYAHPAHLSRELIAVIRDKAQICKYIDLPIQHINDIILKKMNRKTSRRHILSLIAQLRKALPDLAIRTTLIVGFPGETDTQFKELLDFIRETKFERLGLFKYSREKGSKAFSFSQQIPEKVKQSRYEEALTLQQKISSEINEIFLEKRLNVLIDEQDTQQNNIFLGRTQYDAPEVDGCVYVKSKRKLKAGDFVQVKITDTLEYDLVGELSRS